MKIQKKDKEGNKLYPITLTEAVIDNDGKTLKQTLSEILANSGGAPAPTTKSDFNSSFSKDF